MESVDTAALLRCVLLFQRHKRMILMTGFSTERFHALIAMSDLTVLDHTLSCPGTVHRKQFKILIVHIDTAGKRFGQINRLTALVDDLYASCNDIYIFKRGVDQNDLKSKYLIFAEKL